MEHALSRQGLPGLIYLESLYPYAFYNPAEPGLALDAAIVRRDLDRMFDVQPSATKWGTLIRETQTAMVNLDQSLKDTAAMMDTINSLPAEPESPSDLAANKIVANPHPYGAASVPISGNHRRRHRRHLADRQAALCDDHHKSRYRLERGEWFNLGEMDGSLNGNPLDVSLDGDKLTLNPHNTPGTFHGTIAAGALTGDWGSHDPEKLTFHHVAPKDAFPIDPAPHKIRFVTVAPGVKLEVLDFGGNGRPLVFLAGLGKTAHNFDKLALRFTAGHHVYAITRRGFGVSGTPPFMDENYDSDRLGDDVLAVMAALKIENPVLAGHSQCWRGTEPRRHAPSRKSWRGWSISMRPMATPLRSDQSGR